MVFDILIRTYAVVLPIILGYIIRLLQKQNKTRKANSKGTMLLLRAQLRAIHTKYIPLGEIPSYAYQEFMDIYEAYHELGGNGTATKMFEEIHELHLNTKSKED